MDFDETRLYYSHQQLQTRSDANEEEEDVEPTAVDEEDSPLDLKAARRHFREFLREYKVIYYA